MFFRLCGTKPDFLQGKYKNTLIQTSTLENRERLISNKDHIMIFLMFLPDSLSLVLIKYMYLIFPDSDKLSSVIMLNMVYTGLSVDIESAIHCDNYFNIVVRVNRCRVSFPGHYLIHIACFWSSKQPIKSASYNNISNALFAKYWWIVYQEMNN